MYNILFKLQNNAHPVAVESLSAGEVAGHCQCILQVHSSLLRENPEQFLWGRLLLCLQNAFVVPSLCRLLLFKDDSSFSPLHFP